MKRFHVHVHVEDLDKSIGFYSKLFAAEPARVESDYAKWMLDDPRVNFAISQRANGRKGLNHLGLQAESAGELAELRAHFEAADHDKTVAETDISCCYARSNKHWVTDPQGIAWEAFHTLDAIPVYDGTACGEAGCGTETDGSKAGAVASPCCGPEATTARARVCCSS